MPDQQTPRESDRRSEGVQRTRISDGNGGEYDVFTLHLGTTKLILGALASLVVIAATVFGAARVALTSVVQHEIELQIQQPSSPINRQINDRFAQSCQLERIRTERQIREVEDKVAALDSKMSAVTSGQAAIRADLGEVRKDLREIITHLNGS